MADLSSELVFYFRTNIKATNMKEIQQGNLLIVTPSEVICENGGVVVITIDEKTSSPITAQLQKEHCIVYILSFSDNG